MDNRGLTLIEMILYIALIGLVGAGVVSFSLMISGAKGKNYIMSEVNDNARFAMDLIGRKIRNAETVISPAYGTSGDRLTLLSSDGVETDFSVENNKLTMTENGVSRPVTAGDIAVTGLDFTHLDQNIVKIISGGEEQSKANYYLLELTTAITPR
jgi:Tfp pilus assembly protein PilW